MPRQSRVHETDIIIDTICRLDFVSFVRNCFRTLSPNSKFLMNWHIELLAFHLEQVRRDDTGRAAKLAIPRRSIGNMPFFIW